MSNENTFHNWPQALIDIRETIKSGAQREGYHDDEAGQIATRATLDLAEYAGGRQVYIPRVARLRRALRDAEIWEKFTGDNVSQLAREYRLTEQRIYNILAGKRKARREGDKT